MKKREFAFNKLFNLFAGCGFGLAYVSVASFKVGEAGTGAFFGLFALWCIGLCFLFLPCCYLFDKDGVSICYIFLPNERYLWENVYDVTVEYEMGNRSLYLYTYFEILGDVEGEERFYMKGQISKGLRTKRLIKKYWDGEITGYWPERVKTLFAEHRDWFKERHAKKQAKLAEKLAAHLTDEIVPLEREVRREAREWMSEILTEVGKRGADIKLKYYYVTPSGEKLNSRPSGDYTYTVCAESGAVKRESALLRVKLAKTGYRGERVDGARESLTAAVVEMIKL